MFIPTIDRASLYFIAGVVAGSLEAAGLLDTSKHSDNVEVIQSVLGGVTILVTVILGFRHHHNEMQAKLNNGIAEEPRKKYNFQPFIDAMGRWLIKKPETVIVKSTEFNPLDPPQK